MYFQVFIMAINFNQKGINLDNFRNFLNEKKINLVIWGEIHYKHNDIQEELIKKIEPEYLVHECLADLRIVDEDENVRVKLIEKAKVGEDFGFNDMYMFKWGLDYKLKLVGCDLSQKEIEKVLDVRRIIKPRERRFIETINEILDSTSEIVFTIAGDEHLLNSSEIYKFLKTKAYIIRPKNSSGTRIARENITDVVGRVYNPMKRFLHRP